MGARLTLAVALVLGLTSGATADERTIAMLRDWVAAVDRHVPGENDAALSHLNSLSYEDLEDLRAYVETLAEAPTRNNRARARRRSLLRARDFEQISALLKEIRLRHDFDTFRKRAAVLHTDAALVTIVPLVPAPSAQRRSPRVFRGTTERKVIVKSFDGRVENFELQNPHWEFAMDLLDALPATPRRDPIVAQWYRTIGAYLVSQRRFADALTHFERARELVRDDPAVLFGEACLEETLGAPRVQNYYQVTTLPNGLLITGVSSPATHWRRAEGLLRRALAADPAFAEARLRLGRISIQQNKHVEGIALLQQAAEQLDEPALRYFARLFAGEALQSIGRIPEARQSYELAIALFRDSQAARLALAALQRTAGDRAAALETILPTLTKPPSSRPGDDPWWSYYDGDAAKVEALLENLRAPLRRAID